LNSARHILFIAGNARSLVANRGDLIAEMKAAGHRVSAAVPIEDMLESVQSLGIDIHPFQLGRTGMNPVQDLATVWRLRALIRRIKPDMTFTYTIKPVVWGTLAARLAGVRHRYAMITGLGTTFASPTSAKARMFRRLVAMLYRSGVAGSEKVFFQNPDDLQDFLNAGIMRNTAKAVRTMGSGVNLDRFPRAALPDEAPVFLFIARLLREKGIADFAEAARGLKAEYPQARFIAVGPHDPDLPHAINAQDLEKWKAEGAVEFAGGVADVRPWLTQASVFVLPSYYREGTPRSALEAMATGRAVITTDSPGCRETVRDGENGFLVPPRDPAALASAMARFLDEPYLIRRMADASYERAVNEYDVRKVNQGILEAMGLR
jgi:glycosyltransferase involved in cell wall biosynthesis